MPHGACIRLYAIVVIIISTGPLALHAVYGEELSDKQILYKTQAVHSYFQSRMVEIKDPKRKHPDRKNLRGRATSRATSRSLFSESKGPGVFVWNSEARIRKAFRGW